MEYRQALPPSFFFKFYLMVSKQLGHVIPEREEGAIQRSHRPVSQAVQSFEAPLNEQFPEDTVGKPVPHLAAEKQV